MRSWAEGLGVFALVFIGGSALVQDAQGAGHGAFVVDLAFGGTVAIGMAALMRVSGAHFNPAVTIALVASGDFPARRAWAHLLAQFLGATAAALFLHVLHGGDAAVTVTRPTAGLVTAALAEVLGTAVLVFVIFATAVDARADRRLAPLYVGATVTLLALVVGPLSGAGINPARSLGPAIAAGLVPVDALYLVAPVLGGLLGAWAQRRTRPTPREAATEARPVHATGDEA